MGAAWVRCRCGCACGLHSAVYCCPVLCTSALLLQFSPLARTDFGEKHIETATGTTSLASSPAGSLLTDDLLVEPRLGKNSKETGRISLPR